VVWRADHHCHALIDDLFDYDGPVLDSEAANLCRDRAKYITYMEVDDGATYEAPILADEVEGAPTQGDIWVKSAYSLVSPHCDFEEEQHFLKSLVPAAPVRALLKDVRRPNAVAAHIRMATGPEFDHLGWIS